MTDSFFDKNNIDAAPPKSNVPEFSVSELAFSLKRTLEDNFARVRVRGELSRVSIPASGHMYSTLKDDQANIDAVCWKGVLSKLSMRPEEGMEVICIGRISTYPARSNYQLIIESMELAGEGALLKMLEERKKKLSKEGLFAPERKQAIPFLPRKIGVITSPTGAVIRDILHRLSDRFPREVLIWPVLVQGDGAAQQVTKAIHGFNALPEAERPDTLIVARGGGSLEDLMPFNEENVVRAIAASTIPLISAIGHETDTTLSDFAADLRAPTPTGAAEMAVPVRANLQAQILDDEKRLINAWTRLTNEVRHRLDALSAKLGDPKKLLESHMQRLDFAEQKLSGHFDAILATKNTALIELSGRITHPKHYIEQIAQRLNHVSNSLIRTGQGITENPEQRLTQAARLLETLSFKNTLQRGFVVVYDSNGKPVTDPQNATHSMQLEFKDDLRIEVVKSDTKSGSNVPDKTKKRPKPKPSATEQSSLF